MNPELEKDWRVGARSRAVGGEEIAKRLQDLCETSMRTRVDVAKVEMMTERGQVAHMISLRDLRDVYFILTGRKL